MRYPWKDSMGRLLTIGDTVIDEKNMREGYIEYDARIVPCIHVTAEYKCDTWVAVDNKGPKEAYQRSLFDETKSKFYWWRHKYLLPHIKIIKKGRRRRAVGL